MAITTYKASSNTIGVTGTMQFVGRTSCTNPQMLQNAKDLAKSRAREKTTSYLRSIQAEGKTWRNCEATGKCSIEGNSVVYKIDVKFE